MKINDKTKKISINRYEAQVLKDRIKFYTNIKIQGINNSIIQGLLNGDTLTINYKIKINIEDIKNGHSIMNIGEIKVF